MAPSVTYHLFFLFIFSSKTSHKNPQAKMKEPILPNNEVFVPIAPNNGNRTRKAIRILSFARKLPFFGECIRGTIKLTNSNVVGKYFVFIYINKAAIVNNDKYTTPPMFFRVLSVASDNSNKPITNGMIKAKHNISLLIILKNDIGE